MVESVIRAVDPNVAFMAVTASRGKVARAEPINAFMSRPGCIISGFSRSLKA
jgi:phage terminase large subunit-like protein